MEDSIDTSKVLKELNGGKAKGDWIEADGFHVVPAAKIISHGHFSSGLEEGAPVKIFFNKKTGETKMYLVSKLIES